MTFRKLMFLGGIGGLAYAHKKHGGTWTLESIKQSWRDLLDGVRGRVDTLAAQAESRIHDVAGKVVDRTETASSGIGSDVQTGSYGTNTGFGRDDLGYRR